MESKSHGLEPLKVQLRNTQSTLEAFVLVGGTLLHKSHEALLDCVARDVSVRFLFPNLDSRWLKEYTASAGIQFNDYIGRVAGNSRYAKGLGANVSVRYHCDPIPSWFVLCDRKIVATKPVAFFSHADLEITTAQPILERFARMFDVVWSRALKARPAHP